VDALNFAHCEDAVINCHVVVAAGACDIVEVTMTAAAAFMLAFCFVVMVTAAAAFVLAFSFVVMVAAAAAFVLAFSFVVMVAAAAAFVLAFSVIVTAAFVITAAEFIVNYSFDICKVIGYGVNFCGKIVVVGIERLNVAGNRPENVNYRGNKLILFGFLAELKPVCKTLQVSDFFG
jgi:hypothetical protein